MRSHKRIPLFLSLIGIAVFTQSRPCGAQAVATRVVKSGDRPVVLRRIVSDVVPHRALRAINTQIQKTLENDLSLYSQSELFKASRPHDIERLPGAADPTDQPCFKDGFCTQHLPSPGVKIRPSLMIGGGIMQYDGKLAVSLYLFDLATVGVVGIAIRDIEDPRTPPTRPATEPAPLGSALFSQLATAARLCARELVSKHRHAFKASATNAAAEKAAGAKARPFNLHRLLAIEGIQYEEMLNRPEMQLLAVTFVFPGQNPDHGVVAEWQDIKKEYDKSGFRNILVRIKTRNVPCEKRLWPADRDVCLLRKAIYRDWPYRRSPGTFLIDWQGNLIAHGLTLQEAQSRIRLYYGQAPRVVLLPPVDHQGRPIREREAQSLAGAIKDFFARNNRLQLADALYPGSGPNPGEANAGRDRTCGPRQKSAPVYRLKMVHDERSSGSAILKATLRSTKNNCIAASYETPVVDRQIGDAAASALAELVAQLSYATLQENNLQMSRHDTNSIPLDSLPVYDVLARNIMFLQKASDNTDENARRQAEEERKKKLKAEQLGEFWRTKNFTIATRAAFAHYFDHYKIFEDGIKSREAIRALVTFTMGSGEFGFDVEPAYTYEWVSDERFTNFHLLGVNAHAYIKFVLGKRVYATLSAGLIGGYIIGGGIDWGIEAYAHIPYAMNVCLTKNVALEFVIAVGYGVTGMVDNLNQTMSDEAKDMAVNKCIVEQGLPLAQCEQIVGTSEEKTDTVLGHGLLLEAAIGLRFP